ncbi:MAG TPA: hypothetical protein VFZ25_05140 [Chloroflexota bacterium]|nr:hypothetical protein [Chloroflexota bacterium]
MASPVATTPPTTGPARPTPAPPATAVAAAPAIPSPAGAYPAIAASTEPAAATVVPVSPTSQSVTTGPGETVGTATAVPGTASCEFQPVRGFGLLYTSTPKLAARLGCATGQEAGASLTIQSYANGQIIDVPSQKQTFILDSSGKWSSHAEGAIADPTALAALGAASGSARNVGGAIETFQHGTLVWTPDKVIFALFADSGWEQHPDTFVDASPTPAPTSQPPAPTATAAPASVVASCPAQPVRGFGLVYTGQPNVATRLGCASGKEVGFSASRQRFEHGLMIDRFDTHQVFVVRADGSWEVYADTYQNGQSVPGVGAPPANLVAPAGPFGLVWGQHADVRQSLGWATGPAQNVSGAGEGFAGGEMLWTSDRTIYVLYKDKTGASYPDQFVDPAG